MIKLLMEKMLEFLVEQFGVYVLTKLGILLKIVAVFAYENITFAHAFIGMITSTIVMLTSACYVAFGVTGGIGYNFTYAYALLSVACALAVVSYFMPALICYRDKI